MCYGVCILLAQPHKGTLYHRMIKSEAREKERERDDNAEEGEPELGGVSLVSRIMRFTTAV